MSLRAKVTEILDEAKEREMIYDWAKAAKLCKLALGAVRKEDIIEKGQIQERIGYASYRAAMQAESVDEFRDGIRQAVAGYEKAREFYGKLCEHAEKPRTIRCNAMIAYMSYWLASEAPEKKKLLKECWGLTKESLQAFKEAGDASEYGSTYNQLFNSLVLGFCLEWDFQAREKLMKEAIEHGEQAIKLLTAVKDASELARVYAKAAFCLGTFDYHFLDLSKGVRDSLRIRKYWVKAKELSEEKALLELLYPVFGCQYLLWGEATDEALANLTKALEYGRKTRDKFIIGCALDWLTYHAAWRSVTIDDLDEKSRLKETVLQYGEDARQQYSSLSFTSPRGEAHWIETGYAEHYIWLAIKDPKKERDHLEKAKVAFFDALKRADVSGYPEVKQNVTLRLSDVLLWLASKETSSQEKKKLLGEALEHLKEANRITEQFQPFKYWNQGMGQSTLAVIRNLLAGLTEDSCARKNLQQEAIVDMEKALKLSTKGISNGKDPLGLFYNLGLNQYRIGLWSSRLYKLTRNEEHPKKAVKAFAEAAESYQRINLASRVAECHWRAAQEYDTLGEHLEAAESFELASKNYGLAAEKSPQLMGFYSDYASYMRAWAALERSRHEHENENHSKSREHYRRCSRVLETTKKWSYLSPYYFAWSILEHGEALSRLDKPQDAMKAFDEAGRIFGDSAKSLREKVDGLEDSEEKDEAIKLTNIARLRKQYCMGKVLMEEATLSNKKGDRTSSAEKYASAGEIFEEIASNLESEEARGEMLFASTVCRAWEKMELAEERGDSVLYKEAAELFAEAGRISLRKTAGFAAIGNSCFCEALELGMKFMATSNMDFYSGAKLRMENAAGYYQKAGLEKSALWVEATKRLFDAYVYVGKAEAEADPEKRARFYSIADKCLGLSARFYGKAGYRGRKNEVLQSLERVRKERQLAFSLNEVLTAPAVLSSATGVSMPDLTEKPAGLNGFESVNIRASASVPERFIPGEEFQVKLDLVNVGKESGLLVRIEGLVPPSCKVTRMPSYCTLEGASLNMRGKKLDPLCVESISIWVQIADLGGVSLSPQVVYADALGDFRTVKVEEVEILPVVRFESKVAQVVFSYLVGAFVEDCVKRRLGVLKSGWRSFPQIIKEADVSKRSLYGPSGRLGHGLSELQRKGLVDLETFHGERGRGGHILRVRIRHEKELVKRYVKEKAPNLLI